MISLGIYKAPVLSSIGLQYIFQWTIITLAMVCNTLAKACVLSREDFPLQWLVIFLEMACSFSCSLAIVCDISCNGLWLSCNDVIKLATVYLAIVVIYGSMLCDISCNVL